MDIQEKPMQPLWFRFVRMLGVLFFVLSAVCLLVGIIGLAIFWRETPAESRFLVPVISGFWAFLMFACAWPIHRWAKDKAKQYRD